MYYKIINKDSDIYKKLYSLREKEIKVDQENLIFLDEVIGLTFDKSLGYRGQQNMGRCNIYSGFVFNKPENVDLKKWKPYGKGFENCYIPNKRTKEGKKLSQLLENGLKQNSVFELLDILGIDFAGTFTFPYLEIIDDILILYVDNNHTPNDENIIEITSVEFNKICEDYNNKQLES